MRNTTALGHQNPSKTPQLDYYPQQLKTAAGYYTGNTSGRRLNDIPTMEDDPLISSQFKSKKTNVNSSKGAYTNLNLNTRGQTTSQGRNKETASSCGNTTGSLASTLGVATAQSRDHYLDGGFNLSIREGHGPITHGLVSQVQSRNRSGQRTHHMPTSHGQKNFNIANQSSSGSSMMRNSSNKQDVISSGVYTFKNHNQTTAGHFETNARPQTQALKRQPLGSKNSMRALRSVLLDQEKSEVFTNPIAMTTITPKDTQYTTNIKLIVTRDEIAKQKQRSRGANKTVDPRPVTNESNFRDRDSLLSLMASAGPTKPDTLAMVLDSHLKECTVTQLAKTNKAGVFEREKTPEGSQDQEMNNTRSSDGKGEFFQKRTQRQPRVQIPNLRFGQIKLKESIASVHNFVGSSEFKIGTRQQSPQHDSQKHYGFTNGSFMALHENERSHSPKMLNLGGRYAHNSSAAVLTITKKDFDKEFSTMQSELKDLIKMEPYAHRAKKVQIEQQAILDNNVGKLSTRNVTKILTEQEAQKLKQAPKMSNVEIYSWLNNTLEHQMQEEDAKLMDPTEGPLGEKKKDGQDMSYVPKKAVSKAPLVHFEIDRIALDKAGIDQNDVNRIYQGLYATSVGFYGVLQTALTNVHSSERYRVMGRLWKAYQMLLQHCQPTDFQMIGRKLVEDQIYEINKIKEEFYRHKDNLETQINELNEKLGVTKLAFEEASDEREIEAVKRQDIEKKYLAFQSKYEDEVRLRLDFEIKINKLHNLTVAMKNHEVTLNRKIEELEVRVTAYSKRCALQETEIVTLRSFKQKSEITKEIDDVTLISVQNNERQVKDKLFDIVQNLQVADREISTKNSLTLQLQNVLDNRDSKIRALQDIVQANTKKDEEADAIFQEQNKQLQVQEGALQEYMKGISAQDDELHSTKKNLNEKSFNIFELQMAQSRVSDLEDQLDKLLESTTDQRTLIEDQKEATAKLEAKNEHLGISEKDMKEQIKQLNSKNKKLESDLKYMTGKSEDLTEELKEVNDILTRKEDKIKELETRVYQLTKSLEDLEQKHEQQTVRLNEEKVATEQNKESASLWESKFHSTNIVKEKAEKQLRELKEATTQKSLDRDELDKQTMILAETLKVRYRQLEHRCDIIKRQKEMGDRMVLRLSIRKRLLHLLFENYFKHCCEQHGQQSDQIRALNRTLEETVVESEKTLLAKDMEIEGKENSIQKLKLSEEKLVEEKTELKEEVQKWTTNVENSQTRCFFLESELSRADKLADERKVEIGKLREAAQVSQELMEKAKQKHEQDIKVFIDKINAQGKQFKELTMQHEELKSEQSIALIETAEYADAETQTDAQANAHGNMMTQTSNKSQASTNNFKRRQTIAGISRNDGAQDSSYPQSRDSRRNSIANKSPLYSKKLTLISDKLLSPFNQKSLISGSNSKDNASSSAQQIKSSQTGGGIGKRENSSGKDAAADGTANLNSSIYEAESSSQNKNSSAQGMKTGVGFLGQTNTSLREENKVTPRRTTSSNKSRGNTTTSEKRRRVTVLQQISQPRSRENSDSGGRRNMGSNVARVISGEAVTNKRSYATSQQRQHKSRGSNIKGLLRSAINRP